MSQVISRFVVTAGRRSNDADSIVHGRFQLGRLFAVVLQHFPYLGPHSFLLHLLFCLPGQIQGADDLLRGWMELSVAGWVSAFVSTGLLHFPAHFGVTLLAGRVLTRFVLHAGRIFVFVQVGLEGEGLTAAGARVRFRIRVGLDVCPEIRFVGEGLLADTAFERFFTCVRSDVPLQQPRPGETFATGGTLATLVVCTDVHRIGRHRDVNLGTVRTSTSLLVLQRSMRLPMSGQIRRRRILLSAFRTTVDVVR